MNNDKELRPEEIDKVNTWLAEDVASGKITHEQAQAIGRHEVPAVPEAKFPGDIPSAAHIGLYRFPMRPSPDGEHTARAEDRTLRAFIHAAEFDPARGSALGKAINESAERTHGNTPLQNDILGNQHFKRLSQLFGGEDVAEQRMPQIKNFIETVEKRRPGFRDLLIRTGSINDAATLSLLYTQSEIFRERKAWQP